MDLTEQVAQLCMGRAEILPGGASALQQKLRKAHTEQRALRIKLGIDPTGTDLHLGHTVCLKVLQCFTDLGHKPIIVIGGFTAQLGDPSGRNEARPPLTPEQVATNAQTFLEQIANIIDLEKTEIVNNADWLTSLDLNAILKLASYSTINQIIAKDAFGQRLEAGYPLYLHEIFYPLLQGYDSVAVKADIEIGGQDQRFNVLAGRDLQKHFGQDPQIVLLMPLLVGLDGKKKMSKTANNYIALQDNSEEMFGKTMSLPDELLGEWYELLIAKSPLDSKKFQDKWQAGFNPRDLKIELATALVGKYFSREEAIKATDNFITKFQKKEIPADLPEFKVNSGNLVEILASSGLVSSKGEAKRLIQGGGIKVNSQKANLEETVKAGDILQVGKRKFLKLISGD